MFGCVKIVTLQTSGVEHFAKLGSLDGFGNQLDVIRRLDRMCMLFCRKQMAKMTVGPS